MTTRTITTLALVALVATIALACSGGDDDDTGGEQPITTAPVDQADTDTLGPCTDLPGTPTDDLLEANTNYGTCTTAAGAEEFLTFAFDDCTDGRRLAWNDHGYGYTGDVWQAHARTDGQLVPPDADLAACNG